MQIFFADCDVGPFHSQVLVVDSQTHVHSNAQKKYTKVCCQSLLTGAEGRGSHTFGLVTRLGQEGG